MYNLNLIAMKHLGKIMPLNFIFLSLFIWFSSCSNSGQYQFTIIDDKSGEQIPARVYAEDEYGRPLDIDGSPARVQYMGKTWSYSDGSFTLTTPFKDFNLEINHGPETLPVKLSIKNGQKKQIIKLHRWTDMHEQGYINGDVHIHYPYAEAANLQMKAEALDVVNILICEDSINSKRFTGKLDAASSKDCAISVDEEVRDWQMGHLTLLGLSTFNPDYPVVGGTLKSDNNAHRLMAHAMDETHRQGGLVLWSHFSNLPGAESPVAIALGKIDALELLTYNDPTHLPSHWSPWNNSGMSQAEFPIMRGMDLYYQYLNSGFHLPIVAGTDKGDWGFIPMGSNRFYANTNGDKSYKAWLTAIKSGTGFITNGPLLNFQVDGHNPGEIIDFHNILKVHASFSVKSILPFANIEIIVNGRIVEKKTIYDGKNTPVDGVYSMNLETDLNLDKSSWIAARVTDDPDNIKRILPRGLTVFAHTNPIYFQKNGAKVKEKASIEYLQTYVKGTINWLKTNPPFNHPEDRQEALKLAEKAYSVYETIKR